MSNEIAKGKWWAAVPGVKGYLISDHGDVFSSYRSVMQKERKNSCGYKYVTFKPSQQYVHRLVARAFIPNPENKKYVNHKDGNKQNNHVSNLEWVTASENCKHAYATGLSNKSGERNNMAKIPDSEIHLIRERAKREKQKLIALDYNVLPSTISKIVNHIRRNK